MENNLNAVVVAGSGGHARVCIDILQSQGFTIAYCVGSNQSQSELSGIPVLCGDENFTTLRSLGFKNAFVAIGDSKIRQAVSYKLKQLGYDFVNAISGHAIISNRTIIGNGVAIMKGVVLNTNVKIGDFSIINTMSLVEHDCTIGHFVHIGPKAGLAGGVKVDDFTQVGIGANIIPEIVIGSNCIVGAGSVVIENVADGDTVAGVPAKVINIK